MTFEEKLALFKAGGLKPDMDLTQDKLAGLGIGSNPRHLANVMFEAAVSLGSPAISERRGIFIGAHSYMNDGGYLRDSVMIGRYCSIGRRVTIGAGMHAVNGVSTSPFLSRGTGSAYTNEQTQALGLAGKKTNGGSTIIGHDVWVGDGVVILPGVMIGTGAVLGANAVITRDVPSYVIVAGVPAKIIGRRFPQGIADQLLLSRYWELPDEILKTMPVNNVFEFLERLQSTVISEDARAIIPTYKLVASQARSG